MTITIAVFIMMLIAAGFASAFTWVLKSDSERKLLKSINDNEQQIRQLKEEQESLIRHANSLQSEKLKAVQKSEKQNRKLQELKATVDQLEHDKEFIFKEYEQFRSEVKYKLEQSQKLVDLVEELKEKNTKLKLKADKWKIKLHDVQEKLTQTENSYLKAKKENQQFLNSVPSNRKENTRSMLKWESDYKELKLQYLALSKEKQDLENSLSANPVSSSKEESTIQRLSEEVVLLQRENKALKSQQPIKSDIRGRENKSEILERIKNRIKQVDFNRIGKSNNKSPDDLKDLKGLGVLIEQKFNAIGINTFEQLASFNEYDQKLFNFFLELPQGKIESEKWVSQARKKLGKDDSEEEILNRVRDNIDKIDFDRIGQASSQQKDNLQAITGIGPFIEKKLNAIGIFRLEQLARLNKDDIEEINSILELAPDHIKADDWVGQAQQQTG